MSQKDSNENPEDVDSLTQTLSPIAEEESDTKTQHSHNIQTESNKSSAMEFIFPKIVDVFAEVSNQNFLPMFKFLKRALIDPSIDPYIQNSSGFNLFHLVIASSNFQFVKIVSDNFPEFFQKRSKFNQTNLMIAANQKNFDIIRLILEKEQAGLQSTDESGFDLFMYLVSNNSIVLFFYFLNISLQNLYLSKDNASNQPVLDNNSSKNSSEDNKETEQINSKPGIKTNNSFLFISSIFNLNSKDKMGCNMLHWAAFRDAEFLTKFFFRMGCDFSKKDFRGHLPIEKATENNGVRVVHFLNSYSKYSFQTNYFLFNRFEPVEFNFLPNSYAKIESEYESDVLKSDFAFKKLNQQTFHTKNLLYIYSKYNLKYKFGLILYFAWIFCNVFSFLYQMNFSSLSFKILYFSIAFFCLVLNLKFYTFF